MLANYKLKTIYWIATLSILVWSRHWRFSINGSSSWRQQHNKLKNVHIQLMIVCARKKQFSNPISIMFDSFFHLTVDAHEQKGKSNWGFEVFALFQMRVLYFGNLKWNRFHFYCILEKGIFTWIVLSLFHFPHKLPLCLSMFMTVGKWVTMFYFIKS